MANNIRVTRAPGRWRHLIDMLRRLVAFMRIGRATETPDSARGVGGRSLVAVAAVGWPSAATKARSAAGEEATEPTLGPSDPPGPSMDPLESPDQEKPPDGAL